jgi:hypothetical protein
MYPAADVDHRVWESVSDLLTDPTSYEPIWMP